ncbi:MAG TPA: acyltransferase domain-containing protein, partial [Solirubrobacterales bacterium]|nr:acyltransferase domain-containing protein [Solirubrobacterales bacterium]
RAVLFGASGEQVLRELGDLASGTPGPGTVLGEARGETHLAFVFSPFRSEYRGMALGLPERYPAFARGLRGCEEALAPLLEWSLADALHGREGPPPFGRLDVSQLLLLAVATALAELWAEFGVRPDAVLGHSVGEIAAAAACGALGSEDAARLAVTWGRSTMRLEEAGAMASVPLSTEETERRLGPWRERLAIAGRNAPRLTAVSGETAAIEELVAQLGSEGIRARPMGINTPGHSARMAPIDAWFQAELVALSPRPSTVPFHSGVEGGRVDTRRLDVGYWSRNLRQPVLFEAAIRSLREAGTTAFLEIGPRPVLTEAIAETLGDGGRAIVAGDWEQGELGQFHLALAAAHVRGIDVDWSPLLRDPPTVGEPLAVPGPSLAQRLGELPERKRERLLLALVREKAAAVLGHDSPGAIDPGRSFKELGFDSRLAVELRNGLNHATGLILSSTLVFDYPTPRAVAGRIRLELEGAGPGDGARAEGAAAATPEPSETAALREIDDLDLAALVERGLGGDLAGRG